MGLTRGWVDSKHRVADVQLVHALGDASGHLHAIEQRACSEGGKCTSQTKIVFFWGGGEGGNFVNMHAVQNPADWELEKWTPPLTEAPHLHCCVGWEAWLDLRRLAQPKARVILADCRACAICNLQGRQQTAGSSHCQSLITCMEVGLLKQQEAPTYLHPCSIGRLHRRFCSKALEIRRRWCTHRRQGTKWLHDMEIHHGAQLSCVALHER